ncbi:hypothetical protein FE697_009740 [Mumia zhuanghuii]|uniref:DUF5129 domain-containing protein n=2 Tax=Mumia TaxID=1546255 RepID=A0ABW1QPG0_9ACTN|nr:MULTISPECIES: hypothetical protein [Mumia]KAA1423834.1 hypothetical protein FE697_009740 [Mumia zhuanghuii]
MRANRGNRLPSWAAWLSVAALAGLTIGPVVAVLAAGACAAALTAEEVGYRRRARAYFARLHRTTLRRHDAILDAWMTMRDGDADRPSTRLADDVLRAPTARFVTLAARSTDARNLVRPREHETVVAYREAVSDLELAWRRLELHARGIDAWSDARRWGRERLPESATALVAPLVPVVRAAARNALRAAESRFSTPGAR